MATGELQIPTPRVFVPLLKPSRYKGAWGGRGSGKSNFFAECVVEAMVADPNFSVVCVREIQKSLELSAKKLIEAKIEYFKVGHLFEVQKSVIKRIGGKGMCIFQGMQDHTADSIKSLEGFDVAWVEEAQSISDRSLRLLRPTLRKTGSELWFSWNPRRRSDPIEQLLRSRKGERHNAIVVKSNYRDNPFLPAELLQEAVDDKRDDPNIYPHIWLGAYEDMGSKVVIPALWVDAAVGLAKRLGLETTGKKYGGLDVAGAEEGGDDNGFVVRHGIEITHVEKWNGLDTTLTTSKAVSLCLEHGVEELEYDSCTIGEGVTAAWADMERRGERPDGLTLVAWNAGASVQEPDDKIDPENEKSPINKNQYHNLKAQSWMRARKRFQMAYQASIGMPYDPDQIVSLSADIPRDILSQLCDELSQPQQKPSGTGKTMVDKQPDNAPSPNLADPVIMALNPLPTGNSYSLSAWG